MPTPNNSHDDDQPTPNVDELPGAYPETPALEIGGSDARINGVDNRESAPLPQQLQPAATRTASQSSGTLSPEEEPSERRHETVYGPIVTGNSEEKMEKFETDSHSSLSSIEAEDSRRRPQLQKTRSKMTEEGLFRVLSQRRTVSRDQQRTEHGNDDDGEEGEDIKRLLSRMFGRSRQENSEEEQTRHAGVIFKNLTVKGVGLGAALQSTNGDLFLGLPRFLNALFTKGWKVATGKPPVRTLIDDFTGCVRPGEMLLVLGRPGAGCSTFLKVLGNQRFGFEGIDGSVTYGGTDADEMAKKFRSEGL